MKSILTSILIFFTSLQVFAQHSSVGHLGRLFVVDQTNNQVSGQIEIEPSNSDSTLVSAYIQMRINGRFATGFCSGDLVDSEQPLKLQCNEGKMVLHIDFATDEENRSFYRNGSFTSAKFLYTSAAAYFENKDLKYIDVDVKNSNKYPLQFP